MALKVNIIFNQFAQGWTETYYLDGPTDPRSFCTGLSGSFFTRALAFRATGTVLYAVRASVVGLTRQSYTRIVNQVAPPNDPTDPPDYADPDVVSTDAVFKLIGATGHQRNVSLRGLRDADVVRSRNGIFLPSAALTSQINQYVSALAGLNLAIRFESRPPTSPLVWYPVLSVTAVTLNNALSILETSTAPFTFTSPVAITIQGIPRDDLPGLPRNAVCVSAGAAPNQVTIQYRYRGHTTFVYPLKMRLTLTQYGYDTISPPGVFIRFGERKTGRPFGQPVGRARVAIRRY